MFFAHFKHNCEKLQELNVKKLTTTMDKSKFGVRYKAEPEQRVLGGKLKGQFKVVSEVIRALTDQELGVFLQNGEMTVLGHLLKKEDLRILFEVEQQVNENVMQSHQYEAHSDGQASAFCIGHSSAHCLLAAALYVCCICHMSPYSSLQQLSSTCRLTMIILIIILVCLRCICRTSPCSFLQQLSSTCRLTMVILIIILVCHRCICYMSPYSEDIQGCMSSLCMSHESLQLFAAAVIDMQTNYFHPD